MRNIIFLLCFSFANTLVGTANLYAHDPKQKIPANKIFGNFAKPTDLVSEPIGSYARGCLNGGVALPFKGKNWQVMHPKRNRNWGHPYTIKFVKDLSKQAEAIGWKGLYIGDISQPRGGPMPYGHKSHQIGLDVDIWLTEPKDLNLTISELKLLKKVSVRSKDLKTTNNNWTKKHMQILRAAATNESVDRVFITAPAKIWMCENAGVDREWLQKVRPIRGHNKHFHVRLNCPKDASSCVSQKPTIKEISQSEDGCDHTLRWWVTTALEPYKKPTKPIKKIPKKKDALSFLIEDLPERCTSVIHIN